MKTLELTPWDIETWIEGKHPQDTVKFSRRDNVLLEQCLLIEV